MSPGGQNKWFSQDAWYGYQHTQIEFPLPKFDLDVMTDNMFLPLSFSLAPSPSPHPPHIE